MQLNNIAQNVPFESQDAYQDIHIPVINPIVSNNNHSGLPHVGGLSQTGMNATIRLCTVPINTCVTGLLDILQGEEIFLHRGLSTSCARKGWRWSTYTYLWNMVAELRNSYCLLHDVILKNLDKLKQPRAPVNQVMYYNWMYLFRFYVAAK